MPVLPVAAFSTPYCWETKVPPLMVVLFQLSTAACAMLLKSPPLMVRDPQSSFLTVLIPPKNVPPLMVSVGVSY